MPRIDGERERQVRRRNAENWGVKRVGRGKLGKVGRYYGGTGKQKSAGGVYGWGREGTSPRAGKRDTCRKVCV